MSLSMLSGSIDAETDLIVDATRTIRVLGLLSKGFSASDMALLSSSLVASVCSLTWPVPLMSAAITALARFSEASTKTVTDAVAHARVRAAACLVLVIDCRASAAFSCQLQCVSLVPC
jgi:hypothetical protein